MSLPAANSTVQWTKRGNSGQKWVRQLQNVERKLYRQLTFKWQIIFGGEMILEVGEEILKECDTGGIILYGKIIVERGK